MLQDSYPFYLANQARSPNADLEVIDKYSGELATRVAMADGETIDCAIDAAQSAARPMREMKAHERQAVLQHCVQRFGERAEELAVSLCIEAGKPIKDARGEVTRLIDTFRIAAEESVRQYGEVMPLEISPRAAGYSGMWKPVPIGPCSFISPFNFPLNLAAHKVAPALAVGCPFMLKPASLTPIGALIIGEVLAETDLPAGAFSILPCRRDGADLFTSDDRLKLLSFTGSPAVGWDLKARAGKKPVVLELGGNAACIVAADADIEDAIARNVHGGYYQSGQSCIGVQRIFVHRDVYEQFRDDFVAQVAALKPGNPMDEDSFIGPIISDKECSRIETWVAEAVAAGARVLTGGGRLEHNIYQATVLEEVPKDAKVYREEVFGPVTLLAPFDDFDQALEMVNDSAFGLQAGVFTRDIGRIQKAWDQLEVGGVCINEVPSWRVDHMPYGGVKDSGLGREGIRWAMRDMSEPRLLVIRST